MNNRVKLGITAVTRFIRGDIFQPMILLYLASAQAGQAGCMPIGNITHPDAVAREGCEETAEVKPR